MRNRFAGMILVVGGLSCAPALAADVTSSVYDSREAETGTPFGIGAMSSQLPGKTGYSLIGQGERHLSQTEDSYGFREYGEHESRFDAGQVGVGASMQATTGITLVGLDAGEHIFPQIGFEGFSGQFAVSSDPAREKYYEWLPTMSVGIQSLIGKCRFLPLARAGGGVGNLAKSGVVPAMGTVVGAGVYLDCASLDLSAETAHLNAAGEGTDLSRADLSIPLDKGAAGIGLRGERISETNRLEQRVSFVYKSRFSSLLSN
jgi:hypothetical protein